MFTKMILQTITSAFMRLLLIVKTIVPFTDVTDMLMGKIDEILNISVQSINFVHFLVGDTMQIIIPIALGILVYKYLVLPILDVIRRLIPFVNL